MPAIREHGANASDAAAAAAEDVLEAGRGLLEQPLMLERLPDYHAEHRPMTGVSHGRDAIPPPGDEGAEELRVSGEDVPIHGDLTLLARGRVR